MTTITQISSAAFDLANAKQAADHGAAVVITDDRGPSYVMIREDVYRRIMGPTGREMLASQPNTDNIDWEPPRLLGNVFRPVDLT